MQRTRTTAKILMGVAVSAVSATVTGCVAVEPLPAHAPSPVPSADAAPLSRGQDVKPQIVQAPAREALDAALQPSKRAAPRTEPRETPAVRRTAPPAPPRRPADAPAPAPARPAPAAPARPEAAVPVPRVLPSLPAPATGGAGADVCALGEGYGGWQHDSPQARICRETYGR